MENGVKVLSEYRFERAKEMLDAARQNLNINQYRTSLNRSYYAVFHAMRAVNILNGYDSSNYCGVIAYFNKNFLKENKLDRNLYKIIKDSSYLREKSDYDDFFVIGRQETERQLENAEIFVKAVGDYLRCCS